MLNFTTNQFLFSKNGTTFIAESSELDLSRIYWNSLQHDPVETQITLTNPKTGNSKLFSYSHADVRYGEAHGWNFASGCGLELLIIND